MIRITNLSYHHGDEQVLHNLDLEIPTQGVTALVGPNGAGKSTLLGLIARLIPLQSGHIRVGGCDVSTTPSDELARLMTILPQSNEVAPRLTVRELVSFGRYPHHKGRPSALDHQKITAAIATLELETLAHRPLDTLSGGQRQRAFLAMSVAQDTDYLLLDEPLNNLDIAASRSLMQTLQNLAQEHKRTVVIVLHDINYASAYADRIVTLTKGRLGPCGTPTDVLSDEMMLNSFGTDAKVVSHDGQIIVKV